MTRPLRVFLCHSSNDKLAVRELYQKLRAESWIQPWLDEEELYPGQDWNMEIEKAVEAADAIIVCLSKGSITKEGYIQRELRIVLDFADYKPEGTLYIIPVRLEECEPPRRLRSWQYADYFEGQRDRAFQRLLVSLKRRADGLGLAAEELIDKKIDEQAKREAEEKDAHKKLEIEAAENAVREKLKRDAGKIAEIQRLEREAKVKSKREIKEKTEREARRKKQREFFGRITNLISSNSRWLGIGGIILLALIFGGFGLNYLIKNLPVATFPNSSPTVATATVSSPKATATIKPPTLTSVPITSTPQPTKTSIPTPTLGIGSTIASAKDDMVLVYVPAGKFLMGSGDGNSDEKPIHTVNLDAFWIDQIEVTNAMYAKCVADDGACKEPTNASSYTHPSYYNNSGFSNYPVLYVDWNMAKAYCSWADRRLPTEAEWEKAARGTEALTYPWGEGIDCDKANYSGRCVGDALPVKSYPNGFSPYGAYDMAGNVWEWVNDWYDKNYYASSPESNPLGPNLLDGGSRVLRGGSWGSSGYVVRSALRNGVFPTNTNSNIGFRCARSP